MESSYYIQGLLRQANAAYAREYLGIQDAAGHNLLTDFDSSVVYGGYFVNRTPLWNDNRIPMASMRPGAASATPQPWLGGIRAYRFRQGTGDDLEFELQLPHGYNEDISLGIRLHVHWYSALATTPQTVQWNVEVATANLDGQFPAGTATYSNTGLTTVVREHVMTALHTFTGLHESAMIVGRIYRSGVGDTYPNDVFGLSLDAHFAFEKAGSILETGD